MVGKNNHVKNNICSFSIIIDECWNTVFFPMFYVCFYFNDDFQYDVTVQKQCPKEQKLKNIKPFIRALGISKGKTTNSSSPFIHH